METSRWKPLWHGSVFATLIEYASALVLKCHVNDRSVDELKWQCNYLMAIINSINTCLQCEHWPIGHQRQQAHHRMTTITLYAKHCMVVSSTLTMASVCVWKWREGRESQKSGISNWARSKFKVFSWLLLLVLLPVSCLVLFGCTHCYTHLTRWSSASSTA